MTTLNRHTTIVEVEGEEYTLHALVCFFEGYLDGEYKDSPTYQRGDRGLPAFADNVLTNLIKAGYQARVKEG